LERILQIQQPRVSELMRGKLSTLSVARLLLYADLLGAEAEVKLKQVGQAAKAGAPSSPLMGLKRDAAFRPLLATSGKKGSAA